MSSPIASAFFPGWYRLLCFIITAGLWHCTATEKHNTHSSDSVADFSVTDTLPYDAAEPGEEITLNDGEHDSNVSRAYELFSLRISAQEDSFYTVTITSSQYEAGSDATWHFDASSLPVYYNESWHMEGTEGTVEYLIEDNEVVCARVEDYYGSGNEVTLWCAHTGGEKNSYTDNADEPMVEALPEDFPNLCQQELSRYLDILKSLVREGAIVTEWEDAYVVRVENVMNTGPEQEVVEYTEVTIPKMLYEEFRN